MNILISTDLQGPMIALWTKYRPVILQLMSSTGDGPQRYRLYGHEFRALSKNTTFAFLLQAHRGKALNDIRKSGIAQDLLSMLKTSRRASDHLDKHAFEFRLDTQFVLHIARI